ncbi:MAG: hypothetical protein WCO21_00085 [bacterium]
MVEVKNFSEALDANFDRLSAHIDAEREKPSSELSSQKEILKKSLENYAEQVAPLQNTSVSGYKGPVSQATPASGSTLPNYLFNSEISEEIKREVSKLIESVLSENIETAIKESKKHSPFVQDAFHDALVDKLMPELIKRGVFK